MCCPWVRRREAWSRQGLGRGVQRRRGALWVQPVAPQHLSGPGSALPLGCLLLSSCGDVEFNKEDRVGAATLEGVPGQGPRVVGSGMRPGAGGLGSDCPVPPRIPNNSLPYFHKRPQARMLLLALFCVAVSVVWGVFRNEDQ